MPHLKELISLSTVCAQVLGQLHKSCREARHRGQRAELGPAWATGSALAGGDACHRNRPLSAGRASSDYDSCASVGALAKALLRLDSVLAGLMSGSDSGLGDAYQQVEILLGLLAQLHAHTGVPEFERHARHPRSLLRRSPSESPGLALLPSRCLGGLPEELLRQVTGVSDDQSRDAEDVLQMTNVYDDDLDRVTPAASNGRCSASAGAAPVSCWSWDNSVVKQCP